jgi:hypothetical protein
MCRHSDWKVVLEEYKRQANLELIIYRFANTMGVSQATGEEFMTNGTFHNCWIGDFIRRL